MTHLTRLIGPLSVLPISVLFVISACGGDDDAASSTAAGSDGTNGGTTGTTSATSAGGNGSGGSTTGSSQTQTSTTGGGGSAPECEVHPNPSECVPAVEDEQCYTLAELSDPCSGTHLWSVHPGAAGAAGAAGGGAGAGAGGAGGMLMGDGGTDECPSAEELFWGDKGQRCGCYDIPACDTPTLQRGNQCCYQVERSCRLC